MYYLDHSSFVYLIDREGKTARDDAVWSNADDIEHDAKALLGR